MNTETTQTDAERLQAEIHEELGTAPAAKAAGDGDAGKTGDIAADPEDGAADGDAGAGEGGEQAGAAAGDGDGEGEAGKQLDPELLKAVAEDGGHFIPKARFDEATGALKDKLDGVTAQVGQLLAERAAVLKPLGEVRDFAKERAELKERFNNGDDELSLDDYLEAREKLTLEEAEHKARVAALETQAEAQRIAREQQWEAKITAWSTTNADYLALDPIKKAAEDFLAENDDKGMSDEELIEKLDKHVADVVDRFRRLFGAQPAEKQDPPPSNPHAARDAKDAKAQAAASAVPDVAGGGMGERGKSAELDRGMLTREQWAALPEKEKQRLLGE